MAANLTPQHREFIVKKLATFWPPRDIAMQLAAQYGVKCNENDVIANDPTTVIMPPELFMLFRSEREKVLNDPTADPYTDQKARLILLSHMVDRYKNNNQHAEARSVMQQIAMETGVGAKGGPSAKAGPDVPDFKEITVKRTIVRPAGDADA